VDIKDGEDLGIEIRVSERSRSVELSNAEWLVGTREMLV
jgi:hypothetical protein